MSESTTPKKAQDQPGQNGAKEVSEAPVSVGRSQLGEKLAGTPSSRVPRGVGEPPADAVATEHQGVADLQKHVQKVVDEETERGYRGQSTSPVPNENYTVAGVTQGLPTPETVVYTPKSQ